MVVETAGMAVAWEVVDISKIIYHIVKSVSWRVYRETDP